MWIVEFRLSTPAWSTPFAWGDFRCWRWNVVRRGGIPLGMEWNFYHTKPWNLAWCSGMDWWNSPYILTKVTCGTQPRLTKETSNDINATCVCLLRFSSPPYTRSQYMPRWILPALFRFATINLVNLKILIASYHSSLLTITRFRNSVTTVNSIIDLSLTSSWLWGWIWMRSSRGLV